MLKIRLPPEVCRAMGDACRHAGLRETGGMLFAEHVAEDDFRIVEATVSGQGSVASFLRGITDGLVRLERFFRRTKRDYRRFNYLGEWHSHPSFTLRPSGRDDETMFEIVNDPTTGARFAISIIVKLVEHQLAAEGFAYFPGSEREDCRVVLEDARSPGS